MGFTLKPKSGNASFSQGALTYDAATTDPLSGTVNNLNVADSSDVSAILIRATAAVTLNGLVGGTANRQLELINQSLFTVTLAANAAGSTAANRFAGAAVIPTGTTVQLVYNSTLNLWCVTAGSSAGGGGVPGGANTQVQFNDAGAFGGDADFTWDKTTNTMTLGNANTPAIITGPQDVAFVLQGWDPLSNPFTASLDSGDFVVKGTSPGLDITIVLQNTDTTDGSVASQVVKCGSQLSLTAQPAASSTPIINNGPTGICVSVQSGTPNTPIVFGTQNGAAVLIDANLNAGNQGNVVLSLGALAAANTNGFVYLPLLIGDQTGVPAHLTGVYANSAPIRLQNNSGVYTLKAYINGGWRSVALV